MALIKSLALIELKNEAEKIELARDLFSNLAVLTNIVMVTTNLHAVGSFYSDFYCNDKSSSAATVDRLFTLSTGSLRHKGSFKNIFVF